MKNLNVTSNLCPHCNGLGVLLNTIDGELFAKNCQCTEKAIQENKLKSRNLPPNLAHVRVSDYQVNYYKNPAEQEKGRQAKKMTIRYIANYERFKETGKGLYYYSTTKGSGKTMLAIALGNALYSQKGEVPKFATTLDILDEIRATFGEKGERQSQLLHNLKSVNVLILDDIGVERPTSWVNDVFYSLLNDRASNKKITIFTSNSHLDDLKHDERIKSRIEAMALPIQMPEESIRKQLADAENSQIMRELLGEVCG